MSFYTKTRLRSGEYATIYSGFRGVDLSGDGSGISRNRFAYLENMYRDYEGEGEACVESIPGFRKIAALGERINGIYSYRGTESETTLVVHSGESIYRLRRSGTDFGEPLKIATAKNQKSHAYFDTGSLYILDGENIIRVCDGECGALTEEDDGVYIPTTYRNGRELEGRNLLTRRHFEEYDVGVADLCAYGTPTLTYEITDPEARTCAVTGITDEEELYVYVPNRVLIGDTYYTVTDIANRAFYGHPSMVICSVANGTRRIGRMAFKGCTELSQVILPDSVTLIDNGAFADCKKLYELYIGRGLEAFGATPFSFCDSLREVYYGGTDTDLANVENCSVLGDMEIFYEERNDGLLVEIPLFSPSVSLRGVFIEGVGAPYTSDREGDLVRCVKIFLTNKSKIEGKRVRVELTLSSDPEHYKSAHRGFLSSSFSKGGEVMKVVTGCRISAFFDGKVFLSGNPDYPGFCFFSGSDKDGKNHPLYFPEGNYFLDGAGREDNVAMLASQGTLAVFKARDDGGSIFCHTPKETGIDVLPKIYPTSYVHSGVFASGEAISFRDDPVFVTEAGISALDKPRLNLERSIAIRSHNVNPKLLTEELSEISLAVWQGYLAVLANGRIYLADSRQTFTHETGDTEYEWYLLSDIGTYKNDRRVYRYTPTARDGFAEPRDPDGKVSEGVFSAAADGELIYYVEDGEGRTEVYPTDEYVGGDFSPAILLHSEGERLFFGTESGDVCVFNNDCRGAAPPDMSFSDEGEREEYEKLLGRSIHPYYYSFAAHAPRYAAATLRDNCGVPHLEKSTVKRSLTVKCRCGSGARIFCEVGTDRSGYSEICGFPSSDMEFSDMDFSTAGFSTDGICTLPIAERERGWIEKQISIYTNEFSSPFALFNVAYRYRVKGAIKKKR